MCISLVLITFDANNPLFRRSADLECVYFLGSEHIAFQRIDEIRKFWADEIVNAYKRNGKSTTFSRKPTSDGRASRVGRGKGRVPVLRAKG